jgi:hypothetical protein
VHAEMKKQRFLQKSVGFCFSEFVKAGLTAGNPDWLYFLA